MSGMIKVAIPKKDHQLTIRETARGIHIFNGKDTYCNSYLNGSLPNDKYDIITRAYNSIINSNRLCRNCKRMYDAKFRRHENAKA